MFVCKEMQKLRDWLDQHNIPWEDCSEDVRATVPLYKIQRENLSDEVGLC